MTDTKTSVGEKFLEVEELSPGDKGVTALVVKLHTGADGVDGGPVGAANPLATDTPSLAAWHPNQVTVGGTAVRLDPTPLAGRKTITITAPTTNAVSVYIGPTNGITVGTGSNLCPGQSKDFDLGPAVTFWGIASQEGQTVSVDEVAP